MALPQPFTKENRKMNINRNSKNKRSAFSIVELLIVMAVITIVAAVFLPNLRNANAAAVTYSPNFPQTLTNWNGQFIAGATTVSQSPTTNSPVYQRPNTGDGWIIKIVGTNAVTTNTVTINWDITGDGTLWTTNASPFTWTSPPLVGNGTTVCFVAFAPNGANGTNGWSNFRAAYPTSVKNNNVNTNGVTVTIQETHNNQ